MIKNILIPTDFNNGAFHLLRHAVKHIPCDKMNVLFFHQLAMPTSITELLFLSKGAKRNLLINESFKDACEMLKNKHASVIEQIRQEIFYGNTITTFRNHIAAHHIDCIVYDSNDVIARIDKNSIDPYPLIKKSKCTVIDINELPLTGTKSEGPAMTSILTGT